MADDAKSGGSGRTQPSTWWQWILVYPALAIAMFSAAPAWLDAGKAYFLDIKTSELSEAEKLKKFMEKNLSCLGTPEIWVENPENILVDGTICNSGDILIKVQIPKPNDRVFFRGIALNEIVKRTADGTDFLGLMSHASPAIDLPVQRARTPRERFLRATEGFELSQQFSIAVCQKIIDDRTILRHVKVGGTCYDEFIDTYTGEMKNRVQTACRSTC